MPRIPLGQIPTEGHGRDAKPATGGHRKHRTKDSDPDIAGSDPDARRRFLARMTPRDRAIWEKVRYHHGKVNPKKDDSDHRSTLKSAGLKASTTERVYFLPGTMVRAAFEMYNHVHLSEPTEVIKVSWMNCKGRAKTPRMYTLRVTWKGSKKGTLHSREIAVPAQYVAGLD